MTTMITPKKDLYFIGEPHLTENLYGKEGRWYTIREYNNGELIFTSETGKNHIYDEETLNDHYHTIDFEKGFSYNFQGKDHFIKDSKIDGKFDAHIKNCINNIKTGLWEITRYSNDLLTSENNMNKVKPISHILPYENWKKAISSAKFTRCLQNPCVRGGVMQDIYGYFLNNKDETGIFYYRKEDSYFSCKVQYTPEKQWHFVRENKDSGSVTSYNQGGVLYSFDGTVLSSAVVTYEDNTHLNEGGNLMCDDNFVETHWIDKCSLCTFEVPKRDNLLTNNTIMKVVNESDNDQSLVDSKNEWTDKHYDFNYTLTEKDIETGVIKIDPYFVAHQWKLGSKDDSGALWHTFKGIARYGQKNSVEREIRAFHAQIKRLAELNGVEL